MHKHMRFVLHKINIQAFEGRWLEDGSLFCKQLWGEIEHMYANFIIIHSAAL